MGTGREGGATATPLHAGRLHRRPQAWGQGAVREISQGVACPTSHRPVVMPQRWLQTGRMPGIVTCDLLKMAGKWHNQDPAASKGELKPEAQEKAGVPSTAPQHDGLES